MSSINEIIKEKPKVKDFDLQPYGYIHALQSYIDKLELALKTKTT